MERSAKVRSLCRSNMARFLLSVCIKLNAFHLLKSYSKDCARQSCHAPPPPPSKVRCVTTSIMAAHDFAENFRKKSQETIKKRTRTPTSFHGYFFFSLFSFLVQRMVMLMVKANCSQSVWLLLACKNSNVRTTLNHLETLTTATKLLTVEISMLNPHPVTVGRFIDFDEIFLASARRASRAYVPLTLTRACSRRVANIFSISKLGCRSSTSRVLQASLVFLTLLWSSRTNKQRD